MPIRQQAIIWTNVGLIYWHIYVSLGLVGLKNSYFGHWSNYSCVCRLDYPNLGSKSLSHLRHRWLGQWSMLCLLRNSTERLTGHGELVAYWPALRAGLLSCNFFGQPGSVSKFPPLLWVKLWVGWVGRGYTEISRYFPASWINWVTLVTKIKLLYSLRF